MPRAPGYNWGEMKKIISLLLLAAFLLPVTGRAESEYLSIAGKRAKVVGKAALFGTGGGLVVGVASQVFKKNAKNIFVFGSLGLYAGILLGVYVISSSRGPAPWEGPDTYEDYGDFSWRVKHNGPLASGLMAQNKDPFTRATVSMNIMNIPF